MERLAEILGDLGKRVSPKADATMLYEVLQPELVARAKAGDTRLAALWPMLAGDGWVQATVRHALAEVLPFRTTPSAFGDAPPEYKPHPISMRRWGTNQNVAAEYPHAAKLARAIGESFPNDARPPVVADPDVAEQLSNAWSDGIDRVWRNLVATVQAAIAKPTTTPLGRLGAICTDQWLSLRGGNLLDPQTAIELLLGGADLERVEAPALSSYQQVTMCVAARIGLRGVSQRRRAGYSFPKEPASRLITVDEHTARLILADCYDPNADPKNAPNGPNWHGGLVLVSTPEVDLLRDGLKQALAIVDKQQARIAELEAAQPKSKPATKPAGAP